MPASYKECNRVIKEAIEKDEWDNLGVLAETKPTANRPVAHYKAYESHVELYGVEYRAIAIHSSAHDKRRQKRLDRELSAENKSLSGKIKKATKEEFYCLKDAKSAAQAMVKSKSKYHKINMIVNEKPIFKPGRLSKGEVRKIKEMRYFLSGTIEKNDEAVEKLLKEVGCFVMLTNVPDDYEEELYDAKAILKAYKEQHGIEQNFSFLKDPAIIDAIFLKKAERIEILGLIMLISLLIWRLIERALRQSVVNTDNDLPGWKNRRTKRPTSFMLMTKFSGIFIIKVGKERLLNKPLNTQQKEYLKALHLTPEIYRKFKSKK